MSDRAYAKVQVPQKTLTGSSSKNSLLQRTCACGQHTIAGDECSTCRSKQSKLLRSQKAFGPPLASVVVQGNSPATDTSRVPPIVHHVLNGGGGQPLDATTRGFMELRFGYDFSQVRVHTDERAARSARAVNALAYTVGKHVVFGTRQYAPGTSEGRRLLAHELAHVVQQPRLASSHLVLGDPKATDEIDAERTAANIVAYANDPSAVTLVPPYLASDDSSRAARSEQYGLLGAEQHSERSALTVPSKGVIRRILDPKTPYSPPSPLGPYTKSVLMQFGKIDIMLLLNPRSWYTSGARDAVDSVEDAMRTATSDMENEDTLRDASKARLQRITDFYIEKLKKEVARPREDYLEVGNREGNILVIGRSWYMEFHDALDEELKKGPDDRGDYPRPDNPLDLPENQDEDSSQQNA